MTSLIADGWLTSSRFIRIPGHPLKIYSQPNTGENGLACHSVVGEEADFMDGIPNRFLSDERLPDESFTPAAAASCMFILRKRMPHVQMYSIDDATWTSGGRTANTTMWAMEAEGGLNPYSEPLTEHQILGFLDICMAWQWLMGRKLVVGETVLAHWQIAQKYGYAATACESGRYAEAWARLTEENNDMGVTEEQVRAWARDEFDKYAGNYYLDLTRKYWLPVTEGDFSAAPDPDVVRAIATALGGGICEVDAK